MKISNQKIKEFQELHKRHFGQEIDDEQAYDLGIKLIEAIKLVYKPIQRSKLNRLEENVNYLNKLKETNERRKE